jgi:hypothetical protein
MRKAERPRRHCGLSRGTFLADCILQQCQNVKATLVDALEERWKKLASAFGEGDVLDRVAYFNSIDGELDIKTRAIAEPDVNVVTLQYEVCGEKLTFCEPERKRKAERKENDGPTKKPRTSEEAVSVHH